MPSERVVFGREYVDAFRASFRSKELGLLWASDDVRKALVWRRTNVFVQARRERRGRRGFACALTLMRLALTRQKQVFSPQRSATGAAAGFSADDRTQAQS